MKKLLLPFLGLIVIITTSAFALNNFQKQNTLDPVYWDFIGNPSSQQDIEDPEMYVLDSDNTPECNQVNELCEILASPQVGNEDYPDLSTEITSARTFKN